MSICEYYHEETKSIQRRPMRSDRQRLPPMLIRAAWCVHPRHSPVHREIATGAVGAGNLLKCEGDLARCPLTQEQFNDV